LIEAGLIPFLKPSPDFLLFQCFASQKCFL